MSVDYSDEKGMSHLTIEILNRCNYDLEILLERGADVNPKIKWDDMSLLEITLSRKDHKLSWLFLNYDADISVSEEKQSLLVKVIRLTMFPIIILNGKISLNY